ncbi:hypothetical protein [Streptomyces sp. NP160]|uniref:hypothetical protein n=1 Tax=Streptomyces sp. NP160 TaxID=2586637 RepID=UPI0015D5F8C9|nr:hypothetical protein [Streptomyces sp. NP160]
MILARAFALGAAAVLSPALAACGPSTAVVDPGAAGVATVGGVAHSALHDTARWASPPPLASRRRLLQAADLDEALPGGSAADRWHQAMVDMQSAWLRRQCERGPFGDDGGPTAAAGTAPSGEVTQAWARGVVSLEGPSQFATTEALRWDDSGQAASAWVADVAAEAERCEGAVVVDPLGTAESGGASAGGGADVVVVARSWTGSGADLAPGDGPGVRWSAVALVAVGATALQVELTEAGASAGAAGASVAALLEVTAARVQDADDAVRLSGVDDTALAPFDDDAVREAVPPLHTVGPPPEVLLDSAGDVAAAFPDSGAWEGVGEAAVGGGWLLSWCDPGTWLPLGTAEQPSEVGGLWVPEGTARQDGPPALLVDVDVLRWSPDAVAAPGSPAGYAWADAVSTDAADCPRAHTAAAGALPGTWSSAAVTADDDGAWRVQVATTGGPTAVRVRVRLAAGATEAQADAAATSAAALTRRVVANVVRADTAALERS